MDNNKNWWTNNRISWKKSTEFIKQNHRKHLIKSSGGQRRVENHPSHLTDPKLVKKKIAHFFKPFNG